MARRSLTILLVSSSGTSFALVGVLQRLKAELSLVLDVVAEDVAGRDGGDAVVLGEQGGLGALPTPCGPMISSRMWSPW